MVKPWQYKRSFKTRIWLSLVLFTVSAIFVSSTASYYIASGVVEKKAYSISQSMVNKSSQALEEKLRKVRLAVLTFMSNQMFVDVLSAAAANKEISKYELFRLNEQVQNPIFQMKLIEPAITSILISTPIGEFYANNDVRNTETLFKDSEIYKNYKNMLAPTWVESHEDPFFETDQKVLSLLIEPIWTLPIKDVKVLVNVGENSLKDYLLANKGSENGDLFVYKENGVMAFDMESPYSKIAKDRNLVQKLNQDRGNFEYTADGVDYLVNYSRVTFPDHWIVVNIQSKDELLSDMKYIKWMTIATVLGFIILALLLSPIMTRILLKPLNKFQSLIKRVEQDDLTVRFKDDYDDEFNQVGLRFNSMLERIQNLIHESSETEKQKRMAEIKVLQAQIDPHFLYNTLNTILWKSAGEEHEQVREMIMSLSLLFRLGLNNGDELTTIGKELEHVTQYLKLQQKCYENLFNYEVAYDEEVLMKLPILKLLLQPLVENAILHGLRDSDFKGLIGIQVYQTDEYLVMTVQDNGKGMASVTELELAIRSTHTQNSYALRNIYNRLILYYGDNASLHIHSILNEGTCVELKIPLVSLEERVIEIGGV
ncbi:hypothetical protein ASG89_20210 [Paenibacillus sp. Soil766]|uniref:sensor histidine kinase n=1 Tax=Paenibacillus sp. Soil766 TaxID=1736404 RepID=UPI00070BCF9B|nr:sensor histidine kinase [Paenibacillus sp. Soil766]KRF06067.1 hypothetical protein ASG89_20210 [Paenibacillus sp. Soil766]